MLGKVLFSQITVSSSTDSRPNPCSNLFIIPGLSLSQNGLCIYIPNGLSLTSEMKSINQFYFCHQTTFPSTKNKNKKQKKQQQTNKKQNKYIVNDEQIVIE